MARFIVYPFDSQYVNLYFFHFFNYVGKLRLQCIRYAYSKFLSCSSFSFYQVGKFLVIYHLPRTYYFLKFSCHNKVFVNIILEKYRFLFCSHLRFSFMSMMLRNAISFIIAFMSKLHRSYSIFFTVLVTSPSSSSQAWRI